MTFLDRLANPTPPQEAAIACGVAVLTLSGQFTTLERRLISIYRDEFPPLSKLSEMVFVQMLDRTSDLIGRQNAAADVHSFVRQYVMPAIVDPGDRAALYQFCYGLAMADLNVDVNEQSLLDALKMDLPLDPATSSAAEARALANYSVLNHSVGAVALGFIVMAADGAVKQEELADIKAARSQLDTIARLDDTQFGLVYDMGTSIYNRFLTDPNNRRVFLYHIVTPRLETQLLRTQAFHYAASVATSDGDVARAEIDTLKDILTAFGIDDATGEQIFNQFMSRVRTIDGVPNAPR